MYRARQRPDDVRTDLHDRARIVDILVRPNPVARAGILVGLPDSLNPYATLMNARIRNCALVLVLLTATAVGTQAQYAWDFGIHLGGANYLGEMGGKEDPRKDFIWDLKMNQTRWCVGGFARRKINRLISINSGVLYFRIQGSDINSQNPERVGRNLNFRNNMLEGYLRGEFTIFQDNDLGGRGRYKTDFRLFGYAGVAAFLHNPRGEFTGTDTQGLNVLGAGDVVALRPLKTEGVDYSNLGFAVPVGVGFHFTKSRRHRFGWDFGWRTTFTDYLDDASTTYIDQSGAGTETQLMFDQHPYLIDAEPGISGLQVESSNGSIVGTADDPVPNQYQYGYWESNGDSPDSKNKRGDATHNDSYLTMTFTYSYVLKGQSNFYRQRYSWMRGKKRIGRKSRAKF
jgi:hypothetical protein